jgi:hypothetical protein
MSSYKVNFSNNQFINEQGKVLHLKPNAIFNVESECENFLVENFLMEDLNPLSSDKKKNQLLKRYIKYNIIKIAPAGTEFYFQFGLGKHTEEEDIHDSKFVFKAIILEDLYIKSKTKTTWRMCECICEVNQKIQGKLNFDFEKVAANSLSELFANLISTYFNRKRSTACNAFTTFFIADNKQHIDSEWFKKNANQSLERLRKLEITKIKASDIISKLKEIKELN